MNFQVFPFAQKNLASLQVKVIHNILFAECLPEIDRGNSYLLSFIWMKILQATSHSKSFLNEHALMLKIVFMMIIQSCPSCLIIGRELFCAYLHQLPLTSGITRILLKRATISLTPPPPNTTTD